MKTSTFRFALVLLFAGAISLSSCKKDNDEEAPKITEVRINGELAGEHIHVDAASTIEIQIKLTDNEALSQLKIDIHGNDDGHTHGGEEEAHSGSAQGSWEELAIVQLSGTEETITRSFIVPNTVRGEWHLSLRAIDSKGNESPERLIELDIDNDLLPVIEVETVNGLAADMEVEVAPLAALTFVGLITDATGLTEVHIELEANGTVFYEMEYDAAGATSWDVSAANFTLPDLGSAVHAELHIHATDSGGFETHEEIELHIE